MMIIFKRFQVNRDGQQLPVNVSRETAKYQPLGLPPINTTDPKPYRKLTLMTINPGDSHIINRL